MRKGDSIWGRQLGTEDQTCPDTHYEVSRRTCPGEGWCAQTQGGLRLKADGQKFCVCGLGPEFAPGSA